MAQTHVYAGVGGYYGGNEGNLAGVFRRDSGDRAGRKARSLHTLLAGMRPADRLLSGGTPSPGSG